MRRAGPAAVAVATGVKALQWDMQLRQQAAGQNAAAAAAAESTRSGGESACTRARAMLLPGAGGKVLTALWPTARSASDRSKGVQLHPCAPPPLGLGLVCI